MISIIYIEIYGKLEERNTCQIRLIPSFQQEPWLDDIGVADQSIPLGIRTECIKISIWS